MPRSRDHREPAVRQTSSQADAMRAEAVVSDSRQDQGWRLDLSKLFPRRPLGAGSSHLEACCKTLAGVGQPRGALRRIGRQGGKQWLAKPLVHKRRDVVVGNDRLGEFFVAMSSLVSQHRVLNASGGSDEDHATKGRWLHECRGQRNPATKRVADQVELFLSDGFEERGGCLFECLVEGSGSTVSGEINGKNRMVNAECVSECPPTSRGLGEAVTQDNEWPRAPRRDCERGHH